MVLAKLIKLKLAVPKSLVSLHSLCFSQKKKNLKKKKKEKKPAHELVPDIGGHTGVGAPGQAWRSLG